MIEPEEQRCKIEDVGKARNGKHRFWCTTHAANATGRYGAKLTQCEGAYRYSDPRRALELKVEDYPGGLALWGAVPPVYDTTNEVHEPGIHVHARTMADGKKEIDGTFPSVAFSFQRDLFRTIKIHLTRETAVSHYLSRASGIETICLFCTYCGEAHLDAGYFAVKPHRKHLCHGCGRYFTADFRGVSNPIAYVRDLFPKGDREAILAPRNIEIDQADYPGGIQVWASNPAILWSLDRAEECGIHLHAYDLGGARVIDDTFSSVTIDGHVLPFDQVSYLMAQNSLDHLKGKILALSCETCGDDVFDQGRAAFQPAAIRPCGGCGAQISSKGPRRLVVSNPIVRTLIDLNNSAGRVA